MPKVTATAALFYAHTCDHPECSWSPPALSPRAHCENHTLQSGHPTSCYEIRRLTMTKKTPPPA